MSELLIPATVNTPSAEFDAQLCIFKIEGRCIPENPADFFDRLNNWLDETMPSLNERLEVVIRLEYVNSGSSKRILTLLRRLESYYLNESKSILVKWYYEEDDEAIQELGEDFSRTLKLKMQLFSI